MQALAPDFTLVRAPVGLYDSGVGGLSVLAAVRRLMPAENLIYVADNAHVPYGAKPTQDIVERACSIADYFLARGVKALGVACNTATAAAIHVLRTRHPDLPVIGIEPAIKPAAALTRTGVIGVLATSGTLASAKFAALLRREAPQARVLVRACPQWVELVERGPVDDAAAMGIIAEPVRELIAQGADVLVLGCTHFPFLMDRVQTCAGPEVSVLETGPAFARQLQRRLHETAALSDDKAAGSIELLASGNAEFLGARARALLGIGERCAVMPRQYAGLGGADRMTATGSLRVDDDALAG